MAKKDKIEVKSVVTISTGATSTLKIMKIRDFIKYYSDICDSKCGYNPPDYQRETVLKNAGSMMISLAARAIQFEKGAAPLCEFIYIREIKNPDGSITIEIIDGQHRSEMLLLMYNDHVKAAKSDSNKELRKICQLLNGRRFSELNEIEETDNHLMDDILDLEIPVQIVTCNDETASVLFQILNLGKPLNTNDKIRNNWYKNNMYMAIDEACKTVSASDWGMSDNTFKYFVYRCLSLEKEINVKSNKVKELNEKVLEKTDDTTKWTKEKCENMVDKVMTILVDIKDIMSGRNAHEMMAMYMYLSAQSNKKSIINGLKQKKRHEYFAKSYICEKMAASNLRNDTWHNMSYSRAYCPVIEKAWNKAKGVKFKNV